MGDIYSVIFMLEKEMGQMLVPCLIALIICIIWRIIVCTKEKHEDKARKINIKREIALVIFIVYLVGLFSVTLTPEKNIFKPSGESFFHLPDFSDPQTIIIRPPIGWIEWKIDTGDYAELVRNIAGNILIFVPFGFFLPYLVKKAKAKTILFGFLLSFFIEFYQLFTDRQTDLYDLIMNTAGAALGFFLFFLVRLIIKQIRRKKDEKNTKA